MRLELGSEASIRDCWLAKLNKRMERVRWNRIDGAYADGSFGMLLQNTLDIRSISLRGLDDE